MDAYLLVILIVLAVILVIGLFLVLECMESCFLPPLPHHAHALPFIVGNHFAELSDDVEASYGGPQKERKDTPLGGIFSHLQRGTQTLHAQGLCMHGGGAWGTSMSVSGRAATTGNWSPVSGGIYDCCQCEDNGGFH